MQEQPPLQAVGAQGGDEGLQRVRQGSNGHVLRALGKTTAVFKINFTGQWLVSLPLCALIILGFDGSIFWAFAIQPFEELIKALPFRYLARKTISEFDDEKAQSLMYD